MTEIIECTQRECRHTKGCGGALYWWCQRDDKQINIYEDCPKCKEA